MGAAALLLAAGLFFFKPELSITVLLLFLLLCLVAPFLSCAGFFLPVICRGKAGTTGVALTFDDGPSLESTPVLLDLLAQHGLQATFFVVGRKAVAHPKLIADILDQGHSIGNHSLRHDSILMLRSAKTLQADIHDTQEILKGFGVNPYFFRPPAGISNPYLGKVLGQEGLIAVNYSCRALDRGNRDIKNLAEKILKKVRPGDIIMLHDLPPHQNQLSDYWQSELNLLFKELKKNYSIVVLEKMVDKA
jgi:peptidoglycan/xylan/chitin deacetylase (PgdA/CDA1 family)